MLTEDCLKSKANEMNVQKDILESKFAKDATEKQVQVEREKYQLRQTLENEKAQLRDELMREKTVELIRQKSALDQKYKEELAAALNKAKQAWDSEHGKQVNKLKEEINSLKRKYGELETEEITSDKSRPPRLYIEAGFIRLVKGIFEGFDLIPIFDDENILKLLGFIDSPYSSLQSLISVKGSVAADINFGSNLLFVYSDIVAPHFVGDKLTRILRILPIKKGEKHEIVHERFEKPFYYPVRTNRIEDVSFILADENGEPIKFTSGRVLIGLHLKRFI